MTWEVPLTHLDLGLLVLEAKAGGQINHHDFSSWKKKADVPQTCPTCRLGMFVGRPAPPRKNKSVSYFRAAPYTTHKTRCRLQQDPQPKDPFRSFGIKGYRVAWARGHAMSPPECEHSDENPRPGAASGGR